MLSSVCDTLAGVIVIRQRICFLLKVFEEEVRVGILASIFAR